jgi:hypothetical protein
LPHKLLAHPNALLRQNVNDPFRRGLQAQAMKGVPDRSFQAARAHVAILQVS